MGKLWEAYLFCARFLTNSQSLRAVLQEENYYIQRNTSSIVLCLKIKYENKLLLNIWRKEKKNSKFHFYYTNMCKKKFINKIILLEDENKKLSLKSTEKISSKVGVRKDNTIKDVLNIILLKK